MATWSAFYPFVRPDAPGCPNPQIQHALRLAAREFCERSRVWQERTTPQAGNGSTKTFSIVVPTAADDLGAELVRIERCTVAGEEFAVKSSDTLPPDWLESTEVDMLRETCVQIDASSYRLYATPADGDAIQLYLSLKPNLTTSTGVSDVVFAEYADDVARGALARLWAMPNKAWSQPERVLGAKEEFEAAIQHAANALLRQNKPMRTGRSTLG